MAIIRLGREHYAIRYKDPKTGRRKYETIKPGTPYEQVKLIHNDRTANGSPKLTLAPTGPASEVTVPAGPTVAQLCRDYLELHGRQNFTELGYERAESLIRLHIEPDPIGAVAASTLTAKDVKRWQQRRTEAGASDATLDREWNFVRAAIHEAVVNGDLDASPIKRGAIKRLVPANAGRIIYFTPEEWQAFITALDDEERWIAFKAATRRFGPKKIGSTVDTPRRYGAGRRPDSDASLQERQRLLNFKIVFLGLLCTGSRLSEVRLLQGLQLDYRANVVHVEQGKGRGKAKRIKTVPLLPELRAALETLPRAIGAAYVIADKDGKPYSRTAVTRAFNKYKTVAGIRSELTIHSIRHTVASWMVIAGRPIKEVQEVLGHASLSMTLKYVHLAPTHLAAGMATIMSTARATANAAQEAL